MILTHPPLTEIPGIRHAFFSREGGVSDGIYASLNCGHGSRDAGERVAENRARAMRALGRAPEALATVHQVHSPRALRVERPWPRGEAPQADGMATDRPGIVLGILTADCAPVLFADPEAKVIGAAHAGWRGAQGGVLAATVGAMVALGAEPERIQAAIGPCIGPESYEVGPEFPAPFEAEDPANARFFRPARRAGHFLFDLPGYIAARLAALGLGGVGLLAHDTCAEADRFFSYRRATLRGEPDYGRGLSAICLIEES